MDAAGLNRILELYEEKIENLEKEIEDARSWGRTQGLKDGILYAAVVAQDYADQSCGGDGGYGEGYRNLAKHLRNLVKRTDK